MCCVTVRNSIVGERAICDYFIANGKAEALLGGDAADLVNEWREVASTITKSFISVCFIFRDTVIDVLEKLNTFIATRTTITGIAPSVADIAMWAAIKSISVSND